MIDLRLLINRMFNMFRRNSLIFLMVAVGLLSGSVAHGIIKVKELESQYGELQGQLKMTDKTVLLFPSARVLVSHNTGRASIEPIAARQVRTSTEIRSLPDIRALKRKISRLPAYEQVRYWKLHQIRYPDSDVDSELNEALDLVEGLRKEAIESRQERNDVADSSNERNRRYRTSSRFYYPSYGYTSSYRYRRALRRDSQIELDRPPAPRRPVESWDTAMSLADRGRSEALSHVTGARSEILGNTR